MSIGFDPNQPRGHVSNPGRWTAYQNSAPEAGLGTATIDRAREAEAQERMAQIEQAARRFARSYRMSDDTRDEIVQDTAFDLLNQQKMFGLDPTHAHKLVNTAVRAVASRHIDPNVRHEDLTARALFRKVRNAEEKRIGRELTSYEKKQIADDIRENAFAPGRRPGEMFWMENRAFSIDREVGAADGAATTFADLMVDERPESPFATDGSELADLVDGLGVAAKDTLEDKAGGRVERLTTAQVRKDAWNHLARVAEAPEATGGTLTRTREARARTVVESHPGGAAALARAWQSGDSSPAEDSALFAPFGDLGIRDQERVTDMLLRKPEYADDLWGSAADIAARPAAG